MSKSDNLLEMDRMPISCNLLRDALRFYNLREIQVNVRAEGGWDTYYALRNQITISRYNVYRLYDNESVEGNNRANAGERWKMFGDKLGIQVGYFYLIVGSPFLDMVLSQSQRGQPAPLNEEENKKLDRRLEKIKKQLKKKKCKDFLENNLGKDAVTKLIEQLDDQSKRFSGPRSTDITVEEAGFYPPDARQKAIELGGLAGQSRITELNTSVSDWLKNPSGKGVNAIVDSGGRVFYVDFNRVRTILHENLHVSTGLADIPLAEKLGLGKFTDYEKASEAISKALKDNGCT